MGGEPEKTVTIPRASQQRHEQKTKWGTQNEMSLELQTCGGERGVGVYDGKKKNRKKARKHYRYT